MEIYGDAMMGSIIKPSADASDSDATKAAVGRKGLDATIAVLKRHEELIEERRMRERSRFSDARAACADDGTTWTYVLVDDAFARIISCETSCETLEIPATLDGFPVVEIGIQGCANLSSVREITCPDSVESIDSNAFRFCSRLQRLVLPSNIMRFDATWVAQCPKLAEIVCPAMLVTLDAGVFNAENLEVLTLGVATRHIEPGAFAKSKLREIRIPENNPYLSTDGEYVMSKDGKTFFALAVPREFYEVPDGCERIESKAFASSLGLEDVRLPDTVKEICAHAFARTKLSSFKAPQGLRHIGRRAFYRCKKLSDLELNEGLIGIDDEAFAETALESLQLPASLYDLSKTTFDKTALCFVPGRGSCTVAPGGNLRFDKYSALYRTSECTGQKELVCMMGTAPYSYTVEEGTYLICADAFASCVDLHEIHLCEGLQLIGEGAFRSCRSLSRVHFPESLHVIENEAFFDTSLESVYLPARLSRVGERAFVTYAAHEVDRPLTLHSIRVSPNCERFYYTGGLLCERMGKGTARVLLFDDLRESVRIPNEVTEICAFAFSGCQNMHELFISTRVESIGVKGLNINCHIDHIHIDLKKPIDGHTSIDLRFPHTLRSVTELIRGFNTSAFIDVKKLMARYDACVVNMHDYDAKNSEPMDLYGQVTRIVERLRDPIFLTENTRMMYESIIRSNLEDMCVAIARHDDRESIDALIDLGFLNRETILRVIDCVGRLQDAAMTGYLLEAKRVLFSSGTIDFDL